MAPCRNKYAPVRRPKWHQAIQVFEYRLIFDRQGHRASTRTTRAPTNTTCKHVACQWLHGESNILYAPPSAPPCTAIGAQNVPGCLECRLVVVQYSLRLGLGPPILTPIYHAETDAPHQAQGPVRPQCSKSGCPTTPVISWH